MVMRSIVLVLVFFMLPGCADEEPRVCDPGKTDVCLCVGGAQGVQSCSDDGTGWGKCECGAAQPNDAAGEPDIVSGDAENCVPSDPYVSKGCYENSVFWFDSCGNKGELIEACKGPEETCTGGECLVGCSPQHKKGCEGNSVWWFDSCNNKGELIETCPDNTTCGNGECQAACQPKATKACKGNDVYWYDSCGVEETLAEICESDDFCVENKCFKPSYSGTYKVTATPPFQGSPLWTLTYKDGVATLTEPGFNDPIDYVGTIEGKVMKVKGNYTFGQTYEINITATFEVSDAIGAKVPPDVFKGDYIASVEGIPLQVHQIVGEKQ